MYTLLFDMLHIAYDLSVDTIRVIHRYSGIKLIGEFQSLGGECSDLYEQKYNKEGDPQVKLTITNY